VGNILRVVRFRRKLRRMVRRRILVMRSMLIIRRARRGYGRIVWGWWGWRRDEKGGGCRVLSG
jgi:hypothetical protein